MELGFLSKFSIAILLLKLGEWSWPIEEEVNW